MIPKIVWWTMGIACYIALLVWMLVEWLDDRLDVLFLYALIALGIMAILWIVGKLFWGKFLDSDDDSCYSDEF